MGLKRQAEAPPIAPYPKRPRVGPTRRPGRRDHTNSSSTSESDDSVKKFKGLTLVRARRHWHGLGAVKNIITFGDSLTRYPDCTTWLGHFLRATNAHRKKENRITATNFAAPGNTVEDDLSAEMSSFFSRYPAKATVQSEPILNPVQTLYVFWLGTNDCGCTELEDIEELFQILFDALDKLLIKAGARNFLLIDLPPQDRSPGAADLSHDISERVQTWNKLLRSQAEMFVQDTPDASLLLFSAYSAVTGILDDPPEYGFDEGDSIAEGGGIWMDEFHLTSAVHAIIAERLKDALRGI